MMSTVNIAIIPAENIVIDIARICINEMPSGTPVVGVDVEVLAELAVDELIVVGSVVDVDDDIIVTRTLSDTSL